MKKVIIILLTVLVISILISVNINDEDTYDNDIVTLDQEILPAKSYDKDEKVITQNTNYNKVMDLYGEDEYTLNNPYVIVNPYLYNKLSAYIMFDSAKTIESYTYTVEGVTENVNYTYSEVINEKGTIMIPIIGLYPEQTNNVKVKIIYKDNNTEKKNVQITTEEVFEKATNSTTTQAEKKQYGLFDTNEQAEADNEININVDSEIYDEEYMSNYLDNGFILSESYDMYDINGDQRSSFDIGSVNDSLKLFDGEFLTKAQGNTMYKYNIMGEISSAYYLPDTTDYKYDFHHDVIVDSERSKLYVLAGYDIDTAKDNGLFIQSMVFVFDYNEGGYPIDYIDFSDFLKTDVVQQNDILDYDLFHINSIDLYDEEYLILNVKMQSTVLIYNLVTNQVEYVFQNDQIGSNIASDKFLEPIGENFIYPSGEHSVFAMYTDKYNSKDNVLYISMFDNNYCLTEEKQLVFSNQDEECEFDDYSEMLIYKIDLNNKTIELEEEIIADDERYSNIRSSVFTNEEGIYQINYADKYEYQDDGDKIKSPVSDLYIVDEEGEVKMYTHFSGLGNQYRTRLITSEELIESLKNISE